MKQKGGHRIYSLHKAASNDDVGKLYAQYFERIRRIISLKKGPEDAEDLAQKVFIKVLEHKNTFRNQSSVFTWLYRITMNTIIDELRRGENRKLNEIKVQEALLVSRDFTSNVEMRIDLSRALNRFNELDREIITLRFFIDCTLEEIASIVGMRKSAVKNRLYRALGKLRTEILDWGGSVPMSVSEWISLVNILEDKDSALSNKAASEELLNELINNLDKITEHFGPLKKKIVIEIYPDLSTFHEHTGKPDGPDWYVAMLSNDGSTIKIVSPLNPGPHHSFQSVTKAMLSLFASAIALEINREVPLWLKAGIGHYESNHCWGNIEEDLNVGSIPKLSELNEDWGSFSERKGHFYSFHIVEYIVLTHGYEKLKAFIREPYAYTDIFGYSELEFEKRWSNYISQKS